MLNTKRTCLTFIGLIIISATGCTQVVTNRGCAEVGENQMTLDVADGIKMPLVLIRSGEFVMGSPKSEEGRDFDEGPQRQVTISKPFYMGTTEVTQEQYLAIMGNNPSKSTGLKKPVEQVSWNDAVAFCKAASEKSGRTVRLPTEAEWEYACRSGSQTRFSFGDKDRYVNAHTWHMGNTGIDTPVAGKKKPNAWGLYDMHGNVWEWCSDCYYMSYANPNTTDPQALGGEYRVVRGGSWGAKHTCCRSASRDYSAPENRGNVCGFRVVVEVK